MHLWVQSSGKRQIATVAKSRVTFLWPIETVDSLLHFQPLHQRRNGISIYLSFPFRFSWLNAQFSLFDFQCVFDLHWFFLSHSSNANCRRWRPRSLLPMWNECMEISGLKLKAVESATILCYILHEFFILDMRKRKSRKLKIENVRDAERFVGRLAFKRNNHGNDGFFQLKPVFGSKFNYFSGKANKNLFASSLNEIMCQNECKYQANRFFLVMALGILIGCYKFSIFFRWIWLIKMR